MLFNFFEKGEIMARTHKPMLLTPKLKEDLVVGNLYFIAGVIDGKFIIEPPFIVTAVPVHDGHKKLLHIRFRRLLKVFYPERYAEKNLIGQTIGLVKTEDLPKKFAENYLRTFEYTENVYAFYRYLVEGNLYRTFAELTGMPLPKMSS